MRQVRVVMLSTLMVLCSLLSQAQQSVATIADGMVPPLIQFSNVATDGGGSSLSGTVSITFSLYNSQQGGEPLWTETQNNVQLDPTGHYSVQLGITKRAGVPITLFTTGEARWLGVRIDEQVEQPRVLLLSVPYALKAGDATTIGGLPPSAFVLAAPGSGSGEPAVANSAAVAGVAPALSGTGKKDFIPLWLSSTKLGSSKLFQSTAANIGIGTTSPNAQLESVVASDGTLALRLDSGPNSFLDITPVTNSGRAQTQLSSANNRDFIFLPGTGRFGIGTTSPNAQLESVVASDGTLALRLDSGPNSFLDITPVTNTRAQTQLSTANNRDFIFLPGTGRFGIGTTTPTAQLESAVASDGTLAFQLDSGPNAFLAITPVTNSGRFQTQLSTVNDRDLIFLPGTGNVGIGTTSPDSLLSVNGSADKPGGGSWGTFSDGRLKTLNGSFNSGLSQVLKLHPIRYRYKPDNAMGIRDTDEHIGVVAQDVQRVIPEAVTENSKGYLLVNNDPIIWSMLNAIKEQQGEFQQQQADLTKALLQIRQQQRLLRAQSSAMQSLKAEVRGARETLRKVKAQVSAAQPTLVAAK